MLLPKFNTGHGMSTPTPTPPNHPHRTTQNNFYEKKRTLREVIFCEESSFARRSFREKVFFREECLIQANQLGTSNCVIRSRTLRSFTHLHYPTEERTLGSAWVAGVSRISGNLSRSPPANFLRERLYFAPFFTPNDLCANEREQGFTYVH